MFRCSKPEKKMLADKVHPNEAISTEQVPVSKEMDATNLSMVPDFNYTWLESGCFHVIKVITSQPHVLRMGLLISAPRQIRSATDISEQWQQPCRVAHVSFQGTTWLAIVVSPKTNEQALNLRKD
ncbi:hypothetical protein OS493_010122 [Desmophyllum pertusum]|uniref:Uncharacterized protein n=1 Tax=Desmophyllum pertusum TaxID=174260 RepID=A0A9X0CFE9_9CNID|nr:hypothetical protein OS493_010122 [Desmophyllum pertusum]